MGLKFALTGAQFTDAAMPIIRSDPVISAGTLMLLDVGHSLGQIAAGVPASGAVIPNIAYAEAAALCGSGTQTTLSPTWQTTGLAADDAKIERTPKLGIHVIMSQSADEAGDNARIVLPTLLKTYLVANPTHKYAISFWERLTRQSILATADIEAGYYNNSVTPATSHNLSIITRAGPQPTAAQPRRLGGRNVDTLAAVGNVIKNIGVDGWAGTAADTIAKLEALAWIVGGYGGFASYQQNKSRSAVFYRATLEDLTVSGRTYADFDAADLAAYTAAFGAGGRFNGDTVPTDPATFP